jgi:hypothetical protein
MRFTTKFVLFAALLSTSTQAKVLNFGKDWVGFEVFGSYHFLASFSGTDAQLPTTLTASNSHSQTLDMGLNVVFIVGNRAVVRLGGIYATPFPFTVEETATNAAGTNYFTAQVNGYGLGYQAGIDGVLYKTNWYRVYAGGFVGLFALVKTTIKYTFGTAGIAAGETDHTETLSANNKLFYEGHAGIEMAFMDRLTACFEAGYFFGKISGYVADSAVTSFGRTVAVGGDPTYTGNTAKSDRFGGVFGRLVIRSYF